MIPLKLTLQGFIGILSAFGRDILVLDLEAIPDDAQLVALVGPNGSAKTTILDNLHPYRVMPSRSSTLGPGGFSYWTQISGTSASKELIWAHNGVRYRTALSFKTSGKTQKSDCYLYQLDAATGDWKPVQLDDGTLSDGKASTYDRCVDEILGPPEKFFTAHFSAQGRKTLASYQAGDIKSILAAVLNLQHYRELAADAAQVGKLLRQQLQSINDDLAEVRQHDQTVEVLTGEVGRLDSLIAAGADAEARAQVGVTNARDALTNLLAKRDAQAKDADEIRFLNEQIGAAVAKATSSKANVTTQFDREQQLHKAEATNAQDVLATAQREIRSRETEVRRLNAVLAEKDAIAQAVARVPERRLEVERLDAAIEIHQVTLAGAPAVRASLNAAIAEHAKLKSEGQSKVIAIEKLTETAALVDRVPCSGSDMQQRCPLMAQANAAARDVPAQQAHQALLRDSYVVLTARVKELQGQVVAFDSAESEIRALQNKRKAAAMALDDDSRAAAKAPLIADAEARLPGLQESLEQQRQAVVSATERLNSTNAALGAIEAEKAQALARIDTEKDAEIRVLEDRLAKLEKPITDELVNTFRDAVTRASTVLVEAQGRARAHSEQKVALLGKLEAARALVARSSQVKEQATRLHEEIAKWKLLEKGLGNDGCVALSIDDSGPEIAAICNSLLLDCFEGRFIVRLDTQRETQTGNMKETFDVKVFDGHRGTEKSLGDCSGGEEVLVNECLTRSVALYASQSSPTSCETLFTDETDGALDPAAKRTFMQMKRAVLAQGGYRREYFITHTPELWAMADHKIMVTSL